MAKNNIKIFKFEFSQLEKKMNLYRSFLTASEIMNSQKKINAELQRKYFLSRGCLRECIGNQLGLAPEVIKIETSKAGKPFVKDYPLFHFNLSHSKDLLVVAVGPIELGLDLEFMNPTPPERAIESFMALEEKQRYFNFKSEAERTSYFYSLWTAKEAISKWQGEGLKMNFINLEIRQKNSHHFFVNNLSVIGQFVSIHPDYMLAVCCSDGNLNYEIIS